MLLSYIVSCIYILVLGGYWIYTFARKENDCGTGVQIFPGIVISLVCFCLLLLLIIVSIIYFCYLRYKLRLNLKQIVSKTMSQTNKVFIISICIEVALGVLIYFFTVQESLERHVDFIKLHFLFVIMILFVGSFNGLRWFQLKRVWEVVLFGVFLLVTGAMYFLDFGTSEILAFGKNQNLPPLHPVPIFEHYISGPIVITYEYMYLSLGKKYIPENIIVKIIQYGSIVIFTLRLHSFILSASQETFFTFDFIWASAVMLTCIIIVIKDIYTLILFFFKTIQNNNREKYIQKIREKLKVYLETRFTLNNTQTQLVDDDECIICIQKIESSSANVKLDCNHAFHYNCIFQWFNKETTCPVCRNHYEIAS